MKISVFLFLLFLICQQAYTQTGTDSAAKVRIASYYQQAIQYKDGNGVAIDYNKAFDNFLKAANLGDAQSKYAVAYMQYKGLGCAQDYTKAAALFAEGALQQRDNSMYFYALCWRNGYGLPKNEDSAKYWLQKSAAVGYKQAVKELQMAAGENSNDSAAALVQQINNAAIPDKKVLNQYTRIQHHLPASDIIAGAYSGWLIQYDWSGSHPVNSKKLQFIITANDQDLSGQWIEEGADTIGIAASLSADSVLFSNTQYRRKDHYSPDSAVLYSFKNARLNLVQKGDTVFLAGNVDMFSPERKEPSKPLFVALSRTVLLGNTATISLKAYPNPFTNILNADFNLPQTIGIEIQLVTLSGNIVYRNTAGVLEAGSYVLPIQLGQIAAGTYLLKLVYGNQSKTVKVLKQ